ncbi:MAG: phosphoglycerate mutase [Nitrosomonas sp.]|nr:phosphoglycerate mutase [Nitrosomonas sp.]MDP1951291.1 phosphoglycerate mutase [Nitrosomonas sp.]
MINLHLLIPSLFWHMSSQPEIYSGLQTPSLESLLAKGSQTRRPSQGIEASLCNTFGIAKQQNWPLAPIMLAAEEMGSIKVEKEYWLRADPVHLRIEQNHILLADRQVFKVSIKESQQLADVLNKHFAREKLVFLPLSPDRWYLHATNVPNIHTYTLSQVTGKNINDFLPSGKDSMIWHNIFNEIQMLLHDHPINQARQERGELTINSIWFWGGGFMPESISSPYTQIWSNDSLPRALARASSTEHAILPPNAEIWQQSTTPGNHLVVLDDLWRKSQYNDAYGWRENLKTLEQNWFSPLFTSLQRGEINQFRLTTLNENSTMNFTVTRKSLWKFWCRTKPLSTYMIFQP